MTFRTNKNADSLKVRDWSKNNAVFILNMMRAEVYSNFQQIDQGFSNTKAFESHTKNCITSISINNKEWSQFNNEKSLQVKYKVRRSAKKLSKFLIKKGELNKLNYESAIYKVYIIDKGFLQKNNLLINDNLEFIFLEKIPKEFSGTPHNFQYFCGKKDGENFFTDYS